MEVPDASEQSGGGDESLMFVLDATLLREALEAAIWESGEDPDENVLDRIFRDEQGELHADPGTLFTGVAAYAEAYGLDLNTIIEGLAVPEIEDPYADLEVALDDLPDEGYN